MPLADDVKDWHRNLTDGRAQPADPDLPLLHAVGCRGEQLLHEALRRVFKPTEVQMMLAAFSNMETVHIAAYSHLLDTIGMPEASTRPSSNTRR